MNVLAVFLQDQPDLATAQHALMVMIPIIVVGGLIALAIILIPYWFICKKAGFSPWLTLLNIIPFGNLVLIYVLAFAEWKVAPAPQPGWPQPPYPQPPMPPQA
jgi:flagellar basal body-associated protein FliL